MGKKDKKKDGKKGKDDANKLSAVDRTFFELTITDLNQKLARLRSDMAAMEEANYTMKEQIKGVSEERTDVAAYLEKTLAQRDDTITELEERLEEVTKVRRNERVEALERTKDMEQKYKAMHDQLTSEIKLLNGKLQSLDEFRIQRDILLAKFDDQEAEAREKERVSQEVIFNMEQKALVEKDTLKKEVELKLLQVSEDFTRSSEIRNAGYTRRLIRENIALQKEIDSLVLSQIKMHHDFEQHLERNREISEQYNSLDQLKTELIRSAQNKIKIIEKLSDNYDRLKVKYLEALKYRVLYENLAKRDVCDRFTINDCSKKMKILSRRVESLKLERTRLIAQQDESVLEVERLKALVQKIKTTVEAAITSIEGAQLEAARSETLTPEQREELTAMRLLRRRDLLTELLDLISSQTDDNGEDLAQGTPPESRSSLYKPGKMGFLPRSPTTLMDMFKRDAKRLVSAEILATAYEAEKKDSTIIPKSRANEVPPIIDVHVGSSLYVTDSNEDMEAVAPTDEEPEDMGEESSSEYMEEPAAAEEKKPSLVAPPPAPATQQDAPAPEAAPPAEAAAPAADDAGSVHSKERASSEAPSRGSRESRMSRQKSLPDVEDEAFSINMFY